MCLRGRLRWALPICLHHEHTNLVVMSPSVPILYQTVTAIDSTIILKNSAIERRVSENPYTQYSLTSKFDMLCNASVTPHSHFLSISRHNDCRLWALQGAIVQLSNRYTPQTPTPPFNWKLGNYVSRTVTRRWWLKSIEGCRYCEWKHTLKPMWIWIFVSVTSGRSYYHLGVSTDAGSRRNLNRNGSTLWQLNDLRSRCSACLEIRLYYLRAGSFCGFVETW